MKVFARCLIVFLILWVLQCNCMIPNEDFVDSPEMEQDELAKDVMEKVESPITETFEKQSQNHKRTPEEVEENASEEEFHPSSEAAEKSATETISSTKDSFSVPAKMEAERLEQTANRVEAGPVQQGFSSQQTELPNPVIQPSNINQAYKVETSGTTGYPPISISNINGDICSGSDWCNPFSSYNGGSTVTDFNVIERAILSLYKRAKHLEIVKSSPNSIPTLENASQKLLELEDRINAYNPNEGTPEAPSYNLANPRFLQLKQDRGKNDDNEEDEGDGSDEGEAEEAGENDEEASENALKEAEEAEEEAQEREEAIGDEENQIRSNEDEEKEKVEEEKLPKKRVSAKKAKQILQMYPLALEKAINGLVSASSGVENYLGTEERIDKIKEEHKKQQGAEEAVGLKG